MEVKFAKNVASMGLGGAGAQAEMKADIGIGEAATDEGKDLLFAAGKNFLKRIGIFAEVTNDLAEAGREEAFAGGDRLDGFGEDTGAGLVFIDETGEEELVDLVDGFAIGFRGECDDAGLGQFVEDGPGDADAGKLWDEDIEEDEFGLVLAGEFEGPDAITGGGDDGKAQLFGE